MRNTVDLRLPFNGEWLVFWGGDTKELNQHHDSTAQRFAFDFVVTDDTGRFNDGDGAINENYFSYGKDVLAPAKGIVIEASDGVRDNLPGETNKYSLIGNHVIIEHDDGSFSLLAHLKNGSVCVGMGGVVGAGQKIGLCGNSGNSSNAHLHYQLQSSDVFSEFDENYERKDVAKGIKVFFSNMTVRRDDNTKVYDHYSPVKGDCVSN